MQILPSLTLALATLFASSLALPAAAQGLPDACLSAVEGVEVMAGQESMLHNMPQSEFHQNLLATMTPMHDDMMLGMGAADPDTAFVCSMIPHHQGAIDMAEVILTNSQDPFVRQFAEKVIEAQTDEIAQLKKWLDDKAN